MDMDGFGDLTSAQTTGEDGSTDNLQQRLASLQERERQLEVEKEQSEADFGQKRAKFMELFRQKEDEVKSLKDKLTSSEEENVAIKQQIETLKQEIDDIKTAAALSEAAKQDEVESIQRQCHEEVASLQHIMKEALTQDAHSKMEFERSKWAQNQDKLQSELSEMRSKLTQEREGFLASVAKSLQKRVAGGSTSPSNPNDPDNLEESMKRAQEDAEMLRSVVMPLEEEINMMKSKLKDATDRAEQSEKKLRALLGTQTDRDREDIAKLDPATLDEKVKELNHHLETEKASRTDLEMYVAVLNTQKSVLQEDADKLRGELHEVCRLLEQEKREHDDLKRTWQMANDQFLESQRLMMMDMRRMESVLSSEQQRQIYELQKADAEREAQEKRVKELEAAREKEHQQQQERRQQEEKRRKSMEKPQESTEGILSGALASSKGSLVSITSEDLLQSGEVSIGLHRSHSNSTLNSTLQELLDSGVHSDVAPRGSPDRVLNVSLTEAQQKALVDPTPESEASQSILASAKAKSPSTISTVGRRLVSEKEWEMLQQEVKLAREKLGRPCDMCQNYEAQLQEVQEGEKKTSLQLHTLDRQLQAGRQAQANLEEYTQRLENNLKISAEEAQKQISTLVTKLEESEKFVVGMKQQFSQIQGELQDQLKTVTETREEIHKELTKLQEENDSLVGKHSKHSQQMQEECIDFPNTLEELQLVALRQREDLITVKVAKEHVEETLRSEIMFLKDQVLAEQQEKNTMEETLTQEISQLQEDLTILQSVKSELEHQSQLKAEAENKLKESEACLKNIQAKSKQLINALQNQLEEQTDARNKLENEALGLKAKIQSLQVDLDNSEAVQRDFVKLSQSLQIQLEKIRAAEHEVRWQHEEDVDDCSYCKQQFSVTRRKHHCKHCGKIFCSDCLGKTVNSGPNLRPSRVCDVCHTILVQDATPYFSTEPPHTPD